MAYRPSNRLIIGEGRLVAAAGTAVAVVSMSEVHPFTVRFWSLVGGICLVVGGIAATLYCEPVRRYRVRLVWYFTGMLIIAAGAGVVYFVATQNPTSKNVPLLGGAALVIVGLFVSMYSGSLGQWQRRVWLTSLGVLALAVGATVYGVVGYAAVIGHRGDTGTGVVMLSAATCSLAGAAIAFVKAWRTPERPSRQPRWHQVGR